ncbi:MAG: phytanoyl-CoA dioxygenase family protein [bacterium]|nr:hypothetical protein [Deltaproteobacteria bacterium]MCP4907193.1 phytanoyl-CoA dioxygenase family protein [bacterium]
MDASLELSESERAQYRENGFFVRASVFGALDIERLREAAERVVAEAGRASDEKVDQISRSAVPGSDDYRIDGNRYIEAADATVQFEHAEGSRTIRVIEPFHHLDPFFDTILEDPRLVVPICGLLEADRVSLWTDKMNLKRPREGSAFRWHQDSPYWSHVCGHCDLLPNVMVALDDASRENGCFRIVPGSHRSGFLPGLHDGTQLGPLFTDPEYFDESNPWLAEAPAGSLVFFDSHTVHGSEPNHSSRPRRAIVLTYQPADHPMFKVDETRNFSLEAR